MKIPYSQRRKILVRGVNWVGDAIMATPALRRLRRAYPDSKITLLIRPWVAPVYLHNPDIDELWIEDDSASRRDFLAVARRIREADFDLCILFPNSFRSALLAWLGRAFHRVGHARSIRSFLLTRPVKIPDGLLERHEIFYYMNLIEWMMDSKPEPPELVLFPGKNEEASVEALLNANGIPAEAMLVGIAPGSINSEAKRWSPRRFAQVADRLTSESGAAVCLLGSETETDVLAEVESKCTERVHNLSGKLSLGDLIAFVNRTALFIGNDSGAMHVAAALRVPSVAIFGPTDFRTTSPFSPLSKIVSHPVDCAPCMLRECPIDHRCMRGVAVHDVLAMVKALDRDIQARMRALAKLAVQV